MILLQKNVVRATIIFFWLSIFYFFLYSPRFISYFETQKTLNVLAWPTTFDTEYVKEFEKSSNVKVNVTYFENNEELILKIKASHKHGYDLIMPSDLGTEVLIADNLLEEIDHDKLVFWKDIYQELLDHQFDPKNKYTVPYQWSVYGLGIDTKFFDGKIPEASWKLIFEQNSNQPYRIGFLDDQKEVLPIAALYLFGPQINDEYLNIVQAQRLFNLLMQQKDWVAMYTDVRADYLLLSRTCPVVVTTTTDITRVIREDKHISFVVPKEGSFVLIDSFAIPVGTEKKEVVYDFLNYIYRPDILKKYADKFGFFPSCKNVETVSSLFPFSKPTKDLFKRLYFFKPVLPPHLAGYLWIALKA
jgi:spermidine/putrescine transport system substrate-binding protein